MIPMVVVDPRATLARALPKGGIGVEIGVWEGDFSAALLRQARPSELHLIDPWLAMHDADHAASWYGERTTQADMDGRHDAVQARFADQIATGRVRIHRDRSGQVLAALEPEFADFVYIDGDHGFEAVLADLRGALRIVKPGGLICGDDYLLGRWWGDGVVRALHVFLAESPVRIEMVLGSQFMLRKIDPDHAKVSPPSGATAATPTGARISRTRARK